MSTKDDPGERRVDAVTGRAERLATKLGLLLFEERRRRRWSIPVVATKAGVSVSTVHGIENGARATVEMYVRLARALDRELEMDVVDPNRSEPRRDEADLVHGAMGEAEATVLQGHGFPVRVDQPWQHYHYAGRADVIAWDLERSALLHIENRTRFPDVQDAVGRFNTKQEYLATALWRSLGFHRPPRTEVHAMVALWSSEVIRVLRRHPNTFRSIGMQPPDAFLAWWNGDPPDRYRGSTLILFDPLATGKQRRFVGLEAALDGARARVHGYAEAARLIKRR